MRASTAQTVLERVRFEELALTWQRLAANLEKATALLDHFDHQTKPPRLVELEPNRDGRERRPALRDPLSSRDRNARQ